MKSVAVIILAGGESSRMKHPKAFLKFDRRNTFLEKIINEYVDAGIEDIILVINASSLNSENEIILSLLDNNITLIYNKKPEKGRLYSLKLGLSKLIGTENSFIQNIDNPFVSSNLLNKMIPLIKSGSYVSPTYNGKGGHPILISKLICNTILDYDDTSITLRNILAKFNKTTMPYDEQVLININTADDYTKYFSNKRFI